MALDERQLSVVLQASIEKARELIEADGGFRPFGARAKGNGEIEFVQIDAAREDETAGELRHRLVRTLAEEARRGELLGSALIANVTGAGQSHAAALEVLVETPGFSRSIVVPYRVAGGKVEPGRMVPGDAVPVVFRGSGPAV
jgi:hypothetical protein